MDPSCGCQWACLPRPGWRHHLPVTGNRHDCSPGPSPACLPHCCLRLWHFSSEIDFWYAATTRCHAFVVSVWKSQAPVWQLTSRSTSAETASLQIQFGRKTQKQKLFRPRQRRKLRSALNEPVKTPSPSSVRAGEDEDEKTSPPKGAVEGKEDEGQLMKQQPGAVEEERGEKQSTLEAEEAPLPAVPPRPVKKALSPAVAECQRAVYAAFLWQEALVHDAIVSASYLKFHPELSKEMKRDQKEEKVREKKEGGGGSGGEEKGEVTEKGEKKESDGEKTKGEDEKESAGVEKPPATLALSQELQSDALSLPPTLNHLVTFWDEISSRVLDGSSVSFPPPKVPQLAQELLKRYEEEKKEIEKRKKEKDKKANVQVGEGGTTVCELCEQPFPDPVTYHMKSSHPGCGKHANGWGYNSRGTFCSGWAGNCGDGGRGGSTWYLMCKDCHAKYLAMKNEVKKKTVRTVPLPKMKTKKPGKPRSFPVLSAVQGMIQNAKFLLEISCPTDNKLASTPTAVTSPGLVGFSKQASFPSRPADQEPPKTPSSSEAGLAGTSDAAQRPAFLRSASLAATSPLASSSSSDMLRPARAVNSDTREEGFVRQHTVESSLPVSDQQSMGPLVFKPSINLARLVYTRSKHSSESKEVGYGKVMAFILQYHDLNGLRMSMKQAMRVAGIRAFAMEVG